MWHFSTSLSLPVYICVLRSSLPFGFNSLPLISVYVCIAILCYLITLSVGGKPPMCFSNYNESYALCCEFGGKVTITDNLRDTTN